jgi:chromosome segregation ATPase
LGIVLVVTKQNATAEKKKDTDTILSLSNQWERTTALLEESKQVNQNLEKDLQVRKTEFAELTNKFTDTTAVLVKTEGDLKTAQADLVKRDAKIADLEAQNASLDKQALDLSAALTNLTTEIEATQRKLASTEGDKAFLEKELKRLLAEKAELERQFNDLEILRAQVSKLKAEMHVANRLDWIRKGIMGGDVKGAQLLVKPTEAPKPANAYDLNVEVNADGSVRVIPPLTNSPAPAK